MSKSNDGGPFHPVALRLENEGLAVEKLKHPGVSTRAWLAGLAMQAIISTDNRELNEGESRWWSPDNARALALHSLRCADALIAEMDEPDQRTGKS